MFRGAETAEVQVDLHGLRLLYVLLGLLLIPADGCTHLPRLTGNQAQALGTFC